MAEKLTPQQEMAVNDRGGNLLVSAAAGSGKTKVLVDRLLGYLMDPVSPANVDEFLIITYTKAAASELREKIAAKLTQKIAENPGNRHLHRQLQRLYLTTISTVHSFCSDILRQYAYMLDLPADFSVIDDRDAVQLQAIAMEQVLDEAYANENADGDFYAFIDSQGFHRNDREIPKLVMDISEKALCHMQPQKWMDQCINQAQMDGIQDASETIWGKYLMDDLRETVDLEIKTLSRAIRSMDNQQGFEKASALLAGIVVQYQHLLEADTWDAVIDAGDVSYGTLSFSKDASGSELADQIKKIKSLSKANVDEKLQPFINRNDQVMEDLRSSSAAVRGLIQLVRSYLAAYAKLKRNARTLDFSDLEHYTLDLFYGKSRTGITSVVSDIAQRYRQIMVDEYQDSNAIQDAIFDALSRKRNNLFMVGDVKQSIYQFRLADPEIFLEKYNTFAPAGNAQPGQGRKVLLSSNFRSGGGVLDGVNDVFRLCMSRDVGGIDYGEEEALAEGIPHIPLEDPEIQLLALHADKDSDVHEARLVANQIQQLLQGKHKVRDGEKLRPVTADDIVILLRSPRSQAAEYNSALTSLGIACTDDVEDVLFDSDEVGVIRSILTVISNPRQDIPLVAALTSPIFGFTADDLAELRGKDRTSTIYELLLQSEQPKAKDFFRVLNQLRQDRKTSTISGLIEKIYLNTGLDAIYSSMADGELRLEHLEAFFALAVDFDSRGSRSLEQFLTNLDIMEQKGLSVETAKQPHSVRILSIHKSKGLEFPVVFLAGLSKRFNRKDSQKKVLLDKQLGLGLCCVDKENRVSYPNIAKAAIAAKKNRDLLSEEMRILYVAMTRPRDRLIMSFAFSSIDTVFRNMAVRMHFSDPILIHRDSNNLAFWVIYCALQKTEAGELFNLGVHPPETSSGRTVWDIHVCEPVEDQIASTSLIPEEVSQPALDFDAIARALDFRYPYLAATLTPSKQTATQLKERYKDGEVSENTQRRSNLNRWRKPVFQTEEISSAEKGNAIHAVMQYVDFSQCTDLDTLRRELDRLVACGMITQEQVNLIQPQQILAFFNSDLGKRLLKGERLLREFKFSVLVPADTGAQEDQILLQGVVDCAMIEDDGITIVDFKSDRVDDHILSVKTAQYSHQVNAYALALGEVFDMPVKEKWLYFFAMNKAVQLS